MADPVVETDAPLPEGLVDAALAYERALVGDDHAALDAAFEPGPSTVRVDAAGLLVGADAIAGFRRSRGRPPVRTLQRLVVRVLADDLALVVAVVAPASGGRGSQTQLWRHGAGLWRIAAASVIAPALPVDGRIWRLVGAPLVPAGPEERDQPVRLLDGVRVAVKDLFAVEGQRIGGGVPAWLAAAPIEPAPASAVRMLTGAGARVEGIARTDEFAYSIAGANPHYGTPPNAAVPGGLPGGSTSGPASAVALGQADLGLGTDTGGSIRVPASYQGLWGLRTTHGAVAVDGLLPLAPSFDTVGWLTRDLGLLRRVADVAFASAPPVAAAERLVLVPAALAGLAPDVQRAVRDAAIRLGATEEDDVADLGALHEAFRTVQAFEAWGVHGAWITAHPGALRGAVAARFAAARSVSSAEAAGARTTVLRERSRLRSVLAGATLIVPSAASTAPRADAPEADVDRARAATLRITCLAGTAGAPAVSAPLATVEGAPLGVSLVGAAGSDRALLTLLERALAG